MKKGENLNRPDKGRAIKVEPIKDIQALEEIKTLLSDNPRNLAIFTVGINTSLRVGELLNIRIDQIKEINAGYYISFSGVDANRTRDVPLNRACIESIQRLIRHKKNMMGPAFFSEKFLFTGRRGPLSLPILNNMVKRWCQSVNLKGNYGGLTLRKTFGYFQHVHSGKSITELMELLNHSTKKQTIEYLCLSPEECLESSTNYGLSSPCKTCYDLRQRIKFLEEMSFNTNKINDVWLVNEAKFEHAQQVANLGVWEVNVQSGEMFWSDELYDIYERPKELGPLLEDWEQYIQPDDRDKVVKTIEGALLGKKKYNVDHRIITMTGKERYIQAKGEIVNNDEGDLIRIIGTVIDITRIKKSEKDLLESKGNLEKIVKANIDELKSTNKKLQQEISYRIKTEKLLRESEKKLIKIHNELEGKVKRKTAKLEDMNTVLRVLLEKRNENKKELEEKMTSNTKDLIIPYLKKIKKGKLDDNQRSYLKILESNLNDMITPFVNEISNKYPNMTPTEIQIANLIKKGKTTKDMADLLNLSTRTVEFHRDNIRKKFRIKNKKINLRTFLLNV